MKDLRYRAICPICGKPFNIKEGRVVENGKFVCPKCIIYTTYFNYDNAEKNH